MQLLCTHDNCMFRIALGYELCSKVQFIKLMTALFLFSVEDVVHCVNKSLDMGTVEETHTLIQKREGLFPKVLTRSAFLYHDGLYKAKQQALQVRVALFT